MSDRAKPGRWIAHPADRLNVARALAAPPLLFAPFFTDALAGHELPYGCDEASPDPYVPANNSLSWWFNVTTHNFGYHTAHHIRPGAHWTELPDIHRTICNRIPERCLKPFSWSAILMPYHFYRSHQGRM